VLVGIVNPRNRTSSTGGHPVSPTRRDLRRPFAAIVGIVLLTVAAFPVAADSTAQTLPFSQDWHDRNLITANDDWSGVPGVVGFMGQDITTATGADPQTLLTDSAATNDVDVMANLPEANITNGGVGEFDGADLFPDPVVALQGSGAADAPYLRISIDTTGLRNVTVAYNLRDIDDTTDNAVQPVALQFRVGSTGMWTNVPAAFIADATTGPSLATLVTPVSALLPITANDRSVVQVRIITANAVPADEWVGIDDISVTASAMDQPPSVESTFPGDGAADVSVDANLSVTFDEPVDVSGGWYDIKCPSGSHAAVVSGGPLTYTLDPITDFDYDETCTFTVYRQNVTDQDTDDPPDIPVADHVATFQTVAAPQPPTVDAGGPYTVVEGGSVTVTATGSQPNGESPTYRWDLDGDGTFETAGQSVTFSAGALDAPASQSITVQATGSTGLTDTDETTVDVNWAFNGFAAPIADLPAVNPVGPGKLTLTFSLGGNQGLDIFRAGYPASAAYECGSTPPSDADQPVRAQGGKGFSYDARQDEYSFDWKVDKAWKNTCRVFVLGLADGTTHNVAFQFDGSGTATAGALRR
jgi:hypothetical protein